jgi:hypothetical protein
MTLVSLKLYYKYLQITLNFFLVIFLLLIFFNAASLAITLPPPPKGYIAVISLH